MTTSQERQYSFSEAPAKDSTDQEIFSELMAIQGNRKHEGHFWSMIEKGWWTGWKTRCILYTGADKKLISTYLDKNNNIILESITYHYNKKI